jgi:hypothetical protein
VSCDVAALALVDPLVSQVAAANAKDVAYVQGFRFLTQLREVGPWGVGVINPFWRQLFDASFMWLLCRFLFVCVARAVGRCLLN